MRSYLVRLAKFAAMRTGKGAGLWRRLQYPRPEEWAAYLKRFGGLRAMGDHCAVDASALITDPAYTRLGDNVRIADAYLIGHDGSVNMINRAFGTKLDRVGKIDIGNNVFIGRGATILPGVTIGDNVIIGAAAVVAKDVESDSVVVGSPARRVSSLTDYVGRLRQENQAYPWHELIEQREGEFDQNLEPLLIRERVKFFYGDQKVA